MKPFLFAFFFVILSCEPTLGGGYHYRVKSTDGLTHGDLYMTQKLNVGDTIPNPFNPK